MSILQGHNFEISKTKSSSNFTAMTLSDNNAAWQQCDQQDIPFEMISDRNTAASNDDDLLLFADVEYRSNNSDELHSLNAALPPRDLPRDRMMAGNPPHDFSRQFHPASSDVAVPTSPGVVPCLESQQQALVAPSGIAGAIVGLLIGGPVIGAIAGFGSAYAVRKDGAAGDAARALGEAALSVQSTGQEWEEKHHVWKNTKYAIQHADSKMAIHARTLAAKGWKSAVELNQQHNLLERGVEGTGQGFEYVAEKIQSISDKNQRESEQRAHRYQQAPYIDPSETDGTFW
jgi:hypothetical protein